jgi:hypothetical protein
MDKILKFVMFYFIKGNGTVVDSHIPMDVIRRRKEQLKKEIQV